MESMAYFYRPFFFVCCWSAISAADVTYLRQVITDRFSEVRHHKVNLEYKNAAKQFIFNEFGRFGFEPEFNWFTVDNDMLHRPGVDTTLDYSNVIGVKKGSRFGTADDKIIGVAAHYDTVSTSRGVDDNGGGVAAMLEVARQLSKYDVTRNNTIVLVSFDLEEYGLIGSREFITTWVNPWLIKNYGSAARSVRPYGVIVLDTVMHYNTSRKSQSLPDGLDLQSIFPDAYSSMISDDFRGDFLTLIYRAPTADAELANTFKKSWAKEGRDEFEIESLPIPFEDVSQIAGLRDLFRSDHTSLWADNIPAIFITDSANFRGDMMQCYHEMCDDLETMLTEENVNFLAKTADTIARTVNMLSEPLKKDTNGSPASFQTTRLMLTAILCHLFTYIYIHS